MDRDRKLAFVRGYAARLVESHPHIRGVLLGGSVARGNDLPISDVDLWCFVDKEAEFPLKKHREGGLFVDLERQDSAMLSNSACIADSYLCGFFSDAVPLYDPKGALEECCQKAKKALTSPPFQNRQRESLLESIERNYRQFNRAVEEEDAREICRASIFSVWSLGDQMLTALGIPPGGGRGLDRLHAADPESYRHILDFEGSADLDEDRIGRLVETCSAVAERSVFFDVWLDKVEWMFANDYRADAFHALWIALGLRVKSLSSTRPHEGVLELKQAAEDWIALIAWNRRRQAEKVRALREMIDTHCYR